MRYESSKLPLLTVLRPIVGAPRLARRSSRRSGRAGWSACISLTLAPRCGSMASRCISRTWCCTTSAPTSVPRSTSDRRLRRRKNAPAACGAVARLGLSPDGLCSLHGQAAAEDITAALGKATGNPAPGAELDKPAGGGEGDDAAMHLAGPLAEELAAVDTVLARS